MWVAIQNQSPRLRVEPVRVAGPMTISQGSNHDNKNKPLERFIHLLVVIGRSDITNGACR